MRGFTENLLDDELLRAVSVPAFATDPESQESGWQISLRTNRELVCHRIPMSQKTDRIIVLDDENYRSLVIQLNQLEIDYQPKSTCDGVRHRFLTFRSESGLQRITFVDGVSQDFIRKEEFENLWEQLASTVAGVR